ncbi:phage virion morphogenesis protein [Lysobacteraceae bacterium NML08-0793]|nr:phage virion morphogenesis protein [Xanthomonadaceae bacterium NML08-0793]
MQNITIQLETNVQRLFDEGKRRGLDTSGLMADIGEILLKSTQRRFETGLAPDGNAWAPLKSGGPSRLTRGGTLGGQIYASSGDDWAELTATTEYARWHQEGTQPYIIEPKEKKALNIPGVGPRKRVNHPGLPARPFMGVSDEDRAEIEKQAIAWFDFGTKG